MKAYIDDVIVCSESQVTPRRTLLERFRDAKLTVNLLKSEIRHAKLVFLGHEVGNGKIAPVNDKAEAVSKMPVSSTRKEIQRFLRRAALVSPV